MGRRRILKETEHLRGALEAIVRKNVPRRPGIYAYLDSRGKPLYVGRALKDIQERMVQHIDPSHSRKKIRRHMLDRISGYDFLILHDKVAAVKLERSLVRKHRPPYNHTKPDKL